MSSILHNLSRPGQSPVEGDWVEFDRGGGVKERRAFHDPVPVPAATEYVSMTDVFHRLTDIEQENVVSSTTRPALVFMAHALIGTSLESNKARTFLSRVLDTQRANELVP